jgi:signal transduction histidine kinase
VQYIEHVGGGLIGSWTNVTADGTGETVEREKLVAIFRASPAAMALWRGPNLSFEMVNPVYQAIFPGRQLVGLPFLDALPEFEGQPFAALIRQVFETGEPFVGREMLARLRPTPGSPLEDHYYDFTYARIDIGGRPFGVYDHAVDVTDRVRERAMRERFVVTLTHDLRSPLSAARMTTELLQRRGNDPHEVQKLSRRLADSLERIDAMVRNLLDVNRVAAGEMLPINLVELSLTGLVRDVVDEQITIHGGRFVVDAAGDVRGRFDGAALQRLLENLLWNAVKYGDAKRPIRVRVEASGDEARISVHNWGAPIDADEQHLLFEPYRRTAAADAGGQLGWGLGLALVRGVAEAHGGSVRVESSLERGTTFEVRLPIRQ